MTGEILRRLPPELIRKLARKKGRDVGDESVEELSRWLIETYVADVTRAVGDSRQAILERARQSVRRVRHEEDEEEARVPVSEPMEIPETIPSDPALRTQTLAEVYERQGMVPEALAVYRELASKTPDDAGLQEAIDRLTGEDLPEGLKGSGPSVGADAWAPGREKRSAGPVEIPDMDDLPHRYGVDEAVLMMVTPDLMYAFWEVTPETVAAAGGEGELVLRIWRILVDEGRVREEIARDLTIPSTVGEYFIHDMNASGLYRAGVGLLRDGGFRPMVLTNAAGTPSAGPSGRVDEEWMEVDQQALGVRSTRPLPLMVKMRTKLTAREMALLKLHSIGAEAYSGLTGIDASKLREILTAAPRRIPTGPPAGGSSDTLAESG
jgi:hypothetical protein